jgi:hypothetical protein
MACFYVVMRCIAYERHVKTARRIQVANAYFGECDIAFMEARAIASKPIRQRISNGFGMGCPWAPNRARGQGSKARTKIKQQNEMPTSSTMLLNSTEATVIPLCYESKLSNLTCHDNPCRKLNGPARCYQHRAQPDNYPSQKKTEFILARRAC